MFPKIRFSAEPFDHWMNVLLGRSDPNRIQSRRVEPHGYNSWIERGLTSFYGLLGGVYFSSRRRGCRTCVSPRRHHRWRAVAVYVSPLFFLARVFFLFFLFSSFSFLSGGLLVPGCHQLAAVSRWEGAATTEVASRDDVVRAVIGQRDHSAATATAAAAAAAVAAVAATTVTATATAQLRLLMSDAGMGRVKRTTWRRDHGRSRCTPSKNLVKKKKEPVEPC